MPRRYKKQPFKKRVFKAAKYAWKHRSTAVKAYQLATKVARMVNVEYKFVDYNNAVSIGSNLQLVTPLIDTIAPGDGVSDREGNSVKLIRLSGRGFVTQNTNAQKTAIRLILVRAKYQKGEKPVTSEILQDFSNVLSPKNHSTKFGTKILYDKTYHMSNNGNSNITFNWNFKLYGHATWIQANEDDMESGGLYLFAISNEPTNTPILNYWLRTSFTDN